MKFAAAFALAAVASAQVNTLEEISANWDKIVSVINGDLPTLKAANPSIYAQATAVIGGTEITQDYNEELIQQVATGIDPALMNVVLSRAGVTGVTLDGEAIPTDDVEEDTASESEAATSESEEATSESESASDSASVSDSEKESESVSESKESESKNSSKSEDKSSDKSSDDEDDSKDSSDDEDSESSGASIAKLGVAAVAVAAAFF
ncbi:hypothetical protein GGH96_001616 [Coemansia sp. RSA 1972]|nr:hypothetical protein GGH96_001616 [Coemansia sp. RSA 1972]